MVARFDAIVVGAGPAGSTAARELSAAGARVLIVDRAEFPRYKACGGGIPLRTEKLLPFPIDSVVEDSVSLLQVSHQGGSRFVRDSGPAFAHMVMRERFDQLLLGQAEKSGAEFRAGTVVREVSTDGSVRVHADGFEGEAEFLVCADGAHSPVGKMVGLGDGIAECAAWEVEVRAPAIRQKAYQNTALIHLGYKPWGYAWVFPKAEVLSIGIVLPPEQAGRMKEYVREYIDSLGLAGAEVDIARGHKIRFRRAHRGDRERAGVAGGRQRRTCGRIHRGRDLVRDRVRTPGRAKHSAWPWRRFDYWIPGGCGPRNHARAAGGEADRVHVLRHVAARPEALDVRKCQVPVSSGMRSSRFSGGNRPMRAKRAESRFCPALRSECSTANDAFAGRDDGTAGAGLRATRAAAEP